MSDLYLVHHGIKGQKWGVRRYQNTDGSLTTAGKERYGSAADYATPDKKAQKNYYNSLKKAGSKSYFEADTLIKTSTPDVIKKDLSANAKKVADARKDYSSEYEKEVEKCSNNQKILKKYTESFGFTKEKNPAQFEPFKMKVRFIAHYAYGIDVLNKVDHSTDKLKSKKEKYNKAKSDLIGEAQDYTKKLLGEYGDKDLKLSWGNGYYKLQAKTFVQTALQSHATYSWSRNSTDAKTILSRYGINDKTLRSLSNEINPNENNLSNMPISDINRLIK